MSIAIIVLPMLGPSVGKELSYILKMQQRVSLFVGKQFFMARTTQLPVHVAVIRGVCIAMRRQPAVSNLLDPSYLHSRYQHTCFAYCNDLHYSPELATPLCMTQRTSKLRVDCCPPDSFQP